MGDGLRQRIKFNGQQIKSFPDWTSTHGIPQIGRSSKCFCIGFWTLVTLASFGLLVWQVVLIFIQYYQYDVAVQIELQFEQRTFPAVTICDLNPYKKSVAYGYPKIDRLMNTYFYTMEKTSCSFYPDCTIETNATLEADRVMYGLDGLTDTVALQTKVKRLLMLEAAQYNMDPAKAQINEFIQGCSFNTANCVDEDWFPFDDPTMGRCFIFNKDNKRNASRAGPIYGLRIILKSNVSEYLLPSDTGGMRVLVHDQNEYPFPDIFGYNVQVGTATSIGVTFQKISRLGSPYGQCTDEVPSNYLYTLQYATEGCQRSIYQNEMISKCGCYDPTSLKPNGTSASVCVIPDDYDCWNTLSNSTTNSTSKSNCTQPCNEGVYDVTVSSAKWPSVTLTAIAVNDLLISLYYIHTFQDCIEGDYSESCYNVYSTNGALIEVFYQKLNYETMDESPAYTISTLLSNLGGQVGLWLGMSVISVIEFLVLFFQLSIGCCNPKIAEKTALE